MGTRKLMDKIKTELLENKIKIGRDALFTLLRNHGMLIKKNKYCHITTDSKHFYYTSPNLLKETELKHAEQAVVCDITYIKTDEGAVEIYNNERLHWSLNLKTPQQAHNEFNTQIYKSYRKKSAWCCW